MISGVLSLLLHRIILSKTSEAYRRDGISGVLQLPIKLYRRLTIKQAQTDLTKLARMGGSSESKFNEIYRRKLWSRGSPTDQPSDSLSGHGSTEASTRVLRPRLEALLRQEDAKLLFDAPCGDFTWTRLLNFPAGCGYLGGDIVRFVVDSLNAQYGSGYEAANGNPAASVSFVHFDLTKDIFPAADVWLCKDCFQHLSLAEIVACLRNFAVSDIRVALISNHDRSQANVDIPTGDFRYVDLTQAPFNLPPPRAKLEDAPIDGEPRYVGVWDRVELIDSINRISISFSDHT